MIAAFALALGQLTDPRVLRVLVKSMLVTLLIFAVLGSAAWYGLDWLMAYVGLGSNETGPLADLRGLTAALGVLLGGWLLWRILALAVLQFFADEVVQAVEARHYPAAAAAARPLGWQEELAAGLKSAGRAIGWNLLALPVALVLLVTGIGAPLVFALVNAVLIGREMQDLVWLRHRATSAAPNPLGGFERLLLGGAVVGLLAIPFVHFLAPLLGAASAAHLIHRKGPAPHAA